jgi:hypothetical protein
MPIDPTSSVDHRLRGERAATSATGTAGERDQQPFAAADRDGAILPALPSGHHFDDIGEHVARVSAERGWVAPLDAIAHLPRSLQVTDARLVPRERANAAIDASDNNAASSIAMTNAGREAAAHGLED